MVENDLTWGTTRMIENRYNVTGWLAISGAIMFPLAFGLSIIQGVIGASAFGYSGPNFGPSDLLFILITGIGVYVLIMFRRLLHELYEFHELDVVITIAIVWNIVFQIGSLALRAFVIMIWPISELSLTLGSLGFMALAMISLGIIDIVFAVKLFKLSDQGNSLINALAYIGMISGIIEVTVILSPLALLLVPVSFVIYGMVFLKAKEGVEFV